MEPRFDPVAAREIRLLKARRRAELGERPRRQRSAEAVVAELRRLGVDVHELVQSPLPDGD